MVIGCPEHRLSRGCPPFKGWISRGWLFSRSLPPAKNPYRRHSQERRAEGVSACGNVKGRLLTSRPGRSWWCRPSTSSAGINFTLSGSTRPIYCEHSEHHGIYGGVHSRDACGPIPCTCIHSFSCREPLGPGKPHQPSAKYR